MKCGWTMWTDFKFTECVENSSAYIERRSHDGEKQQQTSHNESIMCDWSHRHASKCAF